MSKKVAICVVTGALLVGAGYVVGQGSLPSVSIERNQRQSANASPEVIWFASLPQERQAAIIEQFGLRNMRSEQRTAWMQENHALLLDIVARLDALEAGAQAPAASAPKTGGGISISVNQSQETVIERHHHHGYQPPAAAATSTYTPAAVGSNIPAPNTAIVGEPIAPWAQFRSGINNAPDPNDPLYAPTQGGIVVDQNANQTGSNPNPTIIFDGHMHQHQSGGYTPHDHTYDDSTWVDPSSVLVTGALMRNIKHAGFNKGLKERLDEMNKGGTK